MATRDFHTVDIITVHSHIMVSAAWDGLYDLLSWMTRADVMTHQIPEAARIAGPCLEDQHPWLTAVVMPEAIESRSELDAFHAYAIAAFGATHAVEPMPQMAWGRRDPVADWRAMQSVDPGPQPGMY